MTTVPTGIGLNDLAVDWSPPEVEACDVVTAHRAAELAATLNVDDVLTDGGGLPPLWHWTYFHDRVPTRDLGVDGHPRTGHFLPPMPNRRRMFAGGRVEVFTSLSVGEVAVRRSALLRKVVKRGRMGEMLFVTLRHQYFQGGELRISEEQDLVYRSDASKQRSAPLVSRPLGGPTAPWVMTPDLHPALLFRFSAVTGNAHRIHYDVPYTTGVEGFPALVVHGPLLAVLMAELARTHGGVIRTFEFRLSRPVFVDHAVRIQGRPSGDGRTASLKVVSGDDDVHATASVEFCSNEENRGS